MDTKELEKILKIIEPLPSIRVALFSDKLNAQQECILNYCKREDIEFELLCPNKEFYNIAKEKINEAIYLDLKRGNYQRQGKFYDFLFIDLDIEDRDSFLKKCHKTIKNAGLILIFSKYDNSSIYNYYQALEENYFVATSKIEIDENNLLILSKKMHGWGG